MTHTLEYGTVDYSHLVPSTTGKSLVMCSIASCISCQVSLQLMYSTYHLQEGEKARVLYFVCLSHTAQNYDTDAEDSTRKSSDLLMALQFLY